MLKQIKDFNPNCIAVRADISNYKDVQNLANITLDTFGGIDVLINNAGICNDSIINFMTLEQWSSVMNTNLSSVFYCSKIFSRHMMKHKKGKIISISSLTGQTGSFGQVNYTASKAGIIGLTKTLAKELGQFNISVNAINPGLVSTDLNLKAEKYAMQAAEMSVLDINSSLSDLTNFVSYLSSDLAKGISGQVFNIDSRILI